MSKQTLKTLFFNYFDVYVLGRLGPECKPRTCYTYSLY